MNRQDRAKQFAPFDALKGLNEALRQKEFEHEKLNRRELSEEESDAVQSVILKLSKGDTAEVTCYENGYYIVVKGVVSKIDLIYKFLVIGEGKVAFEDIYLLKQS